MRVILPPELDPALQPQHPDFDLPLPVEHGAQAPLPDLTYVFIVFTHRCGSFYLGGLLGSTGHFNQAHEELSPVGVLTHCLAQGHASYSEYFAAAAEAAALNGHYVVKATIGQLALLAWHGILPRILPRCRFLAIEREDKLAQAISWRIADQTGLHTSFNVPAAPVEPQYDGADLRIRLDNIVRQCAATDLFMALNGLAPLRLTYERMTADPAATGNAICAWLGLPALRCDPSAIRMQKQATALNAAWRARFLAEATG